MFQTVLIRNNNSDSPLCSTFASMSDIISSKSCCIALLNSVELYSTTVGMNWSFNIIFVASFSRFWAKYIQMYSTITLHLANTPFKLRVWYDLACHINFKMCNDDSFMTCASKLKIVRGVLVNRFISDRKYAMFWS